MLQEEEVEEGLTLEEEEELKECTAGYHNALHDVEEYWKQKPTVAWVKEGDSNTKFFHCSTIVRRNTNCIRRIKNVDNAVMEEPKKIKAIFFNYFQRLWGGEVIGVADDKLIEENVPHLILTEDNELLTRERSWQEVMTVIRVMPADKAPGPDGFSWMFYKKFWNIIGSDVFEVVKHVLRT